MNGKRVTTLFLAILSCLILTVSPASFAADTQMEIEKSLVCSCGCGKIVYDCYCDLAKEWKTQITVDLMAGKTKREIINGFVETYGDQVLATPKKSGLEIVIWTIPVFATVLGTVVIYRYARKKAPIPTSEIGAAMLDDDYAPEEDDTALLKYDELFYEEYRKAKEKEERAQKEEGR